MGLIGRGFTFTLMKILTRENFSDVMAARTESFERALEDFLHENQPIDNLHDALIYSLGLDMTDRRMRGKRVRPVLALLTCEALDHPTSGVLPFALAIELMHNFALVHDDIEDGDAVRRNRPAVWKKFGLAHGINIGDYFFCQVYRALLSGAENDLSPETRLQLMELMTKTLDHTHRGQAMDINARGRRELTVEHYLQIVREKTGHYLAAPLLGGGIVAGADEEMMNAMTEYGFQLGPLYQILDDTIDLTSGKGRGIRGSDIQEGKRSFLVAHAVSQCPDEERDRLFDILDAPREQTLSADVDWVVELFRRTGALGEAERYCRQLHARCLDAIQPCPEALRHLLTLFADYLIERTT